MRNEYQTLKEELLGYCKIYYGGQEESPITDEEYDKKYLRLKAMEKQQGFADQDSPTQTIGDSIIHGEKIKHSEKLLSLGNAFSGVDVNTFFKGHEEETYVIEPKIDGMAGAVVYDNGKISLGVSRGDGLVGENITANVLAVDNLPKEISLKDRLEIRGEFAIHKQDFEDINKELIEAGKKPYRTPRNLVAGTMRALDSSLIRKRRVRFYAYGTTSWSDMDYINRVNELAKLGIPRLPMIIADRLEKLDLLATSLWNARNEYDYAMDGVVIKLNSAVLQSALGATHKDPRWAIARKWNAEIKSSVLLDITPQVGRTGVITPVAKIEPVEIGDVTVSSATLHNFNEIERLGVYKGCQVQLIRSGDVIPKIVGIVFDNKGTVAELFNKPTKCPVCQHDVQEIGERLYCSNRYCHGQRLAQITYFVSREGINIVDMGEETVKQLVLKGFVKEPADIYKLTKRNLLALDGFSDKSAEKLLDNIKATTTPSLEKFLVALGIPEVGERTAGNLAAHFQSMDKFLMAHLTDLISIKDIGVKTAMKILNFIVEPESLEKIKNLLVYVKPRFDAENSNNELKGFTFVLTGGFADDRKDIKKVLERYGATVVGSVSSKTTLLIVGENPGSNKLDDAIKNNIPTVEYGGMNIHQIVEKVFAHFKIPKPTLPF